MTAPRDKPHLRRPGRVSAEAFKPIGLGFNGQQPVRPNPRAHAQQLQQSVASALQQAQGIIGARDPEIEVDRKGVYLSFELSDENTQSIDSLVSRRREAELAAVRQGQGGVVATIFIPDGQLVGYESDLQQKIDRYGATDGQENGRLVSHLNSAFVNTLQMAFTDEDTLFPNEGEAVWWEVWTSPAGAEALTSVAEQLQLPLEDEHLTFPDRLVFLAQATPEEMERLYVNSSAIEELRLALDTPETFLELPNPEQVEWQEELGERVTYAPSDPEVAVLILDGGTTRTHQLLDPFLHASDWQTLDRRWLPGENSRTGALGHGTRMAGLALYGDLFEVLRSTTPVLIKHRLEAVKVLPPTGFHRPPLFGDVTRQAVEAMEITNPFRKRVIAMAITSGYQTRSGRPSAWSAAIDQLAFGEDDEDHRRLIVLAAGNIRDAHAIDPTLYPDYTDLNREITSEIESPGQAWNALTIGGITQKCDVPIHLPGWHAYGASGDLAPTSRTSYPWADQWPIKPDVVFEAGNRLSDGVRLSQEASMELLSTHYLPGRSQFINFSETSAATALGARMAAQLYSDDPQRWPETVRGLMVHSAHWTPAMKARMGGSKAELVDAMRHYGYGVPDLEQARFSSPNDVTMVAEDRLQPFRLAGHEMKFGDMHFHPLPWSRIELEDYGDVPLEMRVTLSYFVEPNPSERGRNVRYRYASHGLRFDLKGRAEDDRTFRQRMNAIAREEGGYTPTFKAPEWAVGPKARQRAGSIFSDWWSGPAIELAACDSIAVYPTAGWWKARPRTVYADRQARYSLIVSLRTVDPELSVDLYTPILTLIQAENAVIIS